jgi:outer membrane protein assembly factor BamB
VATGTYIEYGELPGRLCCLDPSRTGDISLELDDGSGKGRPNPRSGAIWHFDGIKRTMSLIAIQNGLLIAPDFAGYVHCLDAATGRTNWIHDMKAHILGSPLIVDGKIYVGDEDGNMSVFALSKVKSLLFTQNFEAPIASAPIFANGVLYLAAGGTLYAIQQGASSPPP